MNQKLKNPRLERRVDAVDRVLTKVSQDSNGCWVFQGSLTGNGYGRINTPNGVRPAHRVTYEYFISEVPEGLVLDHLCRNRACVNPYHLDPVTQSVNLARGKPRSVPKTKCSQGHDMFIHRRVYPSGSSRCGACEDERRGVVRC